MPTPEEIRSTVAAYVAAYKANDRASLVALYAPDAVWIDPVGTPAHNGPEAVGAFWDTAHSMADSIELRPVHVHVCGDEAALVMEIHTMIGGTKMIIDAVDIFTFDNEARIKTGKAYWELERARSGPS